MDIGHDNGGYLHVGHDHGGYVAENYEQYQNHEPFYEHDNTRNYSTPHHLDYQQDQRYVQHNHQGYNGDDY